MDCQKQVYEVVQVHLDQLFLYPLFEIKSSYCGPLGIWPSGARESLPPIW
jgi:hypothetical protein